jgi:hypothetical protein
MRTLLWVAVLAMTAAATDEAWRDGKIQSEAPLLCPTLIRAELEGLVQRM